MLQWILVCTVGLVLASACSAPAFAVDASPAVSCRTWDCENGGGSTDHVGEMLPIPVALMACIGMLTSGVGVCL